MNTLVTYSKFNLMHRVNDNSINNEYHFKSSNNFNIQDAGEDSKLITHFGDYISDSRNLLIKYEISHKIKSTLTERLNIERIKENIEKIDKLILEGYCSNIE